MCAGGACAREWTIGCDLITGGFRIFRSRRREPNKNPTPPESPESLKDIVRGSEPLQLASAHLCPSISTFLEEWDPHPPPQPGRAAARLFPVFLLFLPPWSEGNSGSNSARGSSISPGGKGGGERRRAAEEEFLCGPEPSVGPAEEERPSPRALIAVALCPSPPACV